MSKAIGAVHIFQAAEKAIIEWHEKRGDDVYCATELAEAIAEGWDSMTKAKASMAQRDSIYKAVVQVLKIKAETSPRDRLLPRKDASLKLIAEMTVKQLFS